MIQFVEVECPNCGGKLTKTGENTATCVHCDAEFLIDKGQPARVTNVYQAPAKTSSNSNTAAIVVTIFSFLIIVIVTLIGTMSHDEPAPTETTVTEQPQKVYSEFFRCFAKAAFQMTPDQVTAQQLAKITFLSIDRNFDGVHVEYALENGALQSIEMSSEANSYFDDIEKFTQLSSLDLQSLSLTTGDLRSFTNLTEIKTRNSPDELAQIVSNPEKITSLTSYSASDLTGINVFSNSEQLSLVCNDELSDLSDTTMSPICDLWVS